MLFVKGVKLVSNLFIWQDEKEFKEKTTKTKKTQETKTFPRKNICEIR